ncbi:PREDICTED: pentatricopeptide repeat-containing protein 2, mitochondrial-like [Ceratosolen solmsi marchali]|uniref:Pentatricopeptide repeat-containing protein 2, mitochondrial-like n=1 Tax=Ceratosolen solmsi marchali TaxID=326594 RepID=A0AAJ7DTD6_9HYME|nr:PREDICTED: pentatricopeptide repeat-containing protein 2, mitochondrial-like [Ceratosolen solmsi marchali]
MAKQITNIAKNGFSLFNKNTLSCVNINVTRLLYTPNSLGLDGYLNSRDYVKHQFLSMDTMFRQKMNDNISNYGDERLIFTEDLKNMLHLVEKNPSDLELMLKMIKKYNSQNKLRFGSFVFGTIVMRVYYYLDEVDLALNALRDPELNGFFDQITSYQLIMDLLYNHGKYIEIKELYDDLQQKCINGQPHPRNPFILVMAACYKENTPESYDYALKVLKDSQLKGNRNPRRSIMYLAALALKQNDPQTALEITSLARNPNYIAIRCLKIESYVKLKRPEEIMIYLRNSLQVDSSATKLSYFSDTVYKIDNFINEENLESNHDLVQLLKQIKQQDFIQTGTLSNHLDSEIQVLKHDRNQTFDKEFNHNRKRKVTFPEMRGVV